MTSHQRVSLPGSIMFVAIGLLLFGLIMVFSASGMQRNLAAGMSTGASMFSFFMRQLLGTFVGLIAMAVCSQIKVEWWMKLSRLCLVGSIVALVLCYVPGVASPQVSGGNHVYRWIALGGFRFQPSETVKLLLVIYLACAWGRKLEHNGPGLRNAWPQLVVVAIPLVLIMLQPDKSTALFIGLVAGVMWFLAQASLLQLGFGALGLGCCGAAFIVQSDYAVRRMVHWWGGDPTIQWQTRQTAIAFQQGGVCGVGLGAGQQKLGYLPESHNDMIFALVGEETGFVGAMAVIVAYGILAYLGFRVATRCTKPVPSLLASGVTVLVVGQALLNIAVATMVVPTTGLCLPFISYGSTSLVVSMAAIGVLLHVARSVQDGEDAAWGSR